MNVDLCQFVVVDALQPYVAADALQLIGTVAGCILQLLLKVCCSGFWCSRYNLLQLHIVGWGPRWYRCRQLMQVHRCRCRQLVQVHGCRCRQLMQVQAADDAGILEPCLPTLPPHLRFVRHAPWSRRCAPYGWLPPFCSINHSNCIKPRSCYRCSSQAAAVSADVYSTFGWTNNCNDTR